MKKFLNILLAFIILIAQSGFVYQAHYCGEEIVEEHLGFTFNDISCGMSEEIGQDCNKDSDTETIEKSNCCKNVGSYNKLSTERDFSSVEINIESSGFNPIPFVGKSSTLYVLDIPVQLRSLPPPEYQGKNNLSNILSQAEYLAFIQSYLC